MRLVSLAGVIAVFAAGSLQLAAAARAPGQRLVDYIAAHGRRGDVAQLRGLELVGGRVQVVNGQQVVRGVTAVVLTRLAPTSQASFVAQRLCVDAIVARNKLGLARVSGVEVRDRGGRAQAESVFLRYPTCHRIPPG
jgi:hypothetical protein